MSAYLLTYDVGAAAALQPQLLAFVKDNRHIQQWSHPYPGLYLIKSSATVWTLAESFRGFFTDFKNHVIVPLDPNTTQGILPTNFWDWLRQPETSGLSNLLSLFPPQPWPGSQ